STARSYSYGAGESSPGSLPFGTYRRTTASSRRRCLVAGGRPSQRMLLISWIVGGAITGLAYLWQAEPAHAPHLSIERRRLAGLLGPQLANHRPHHVSVEAAAQQKAAQLAPELAVVGSLERAQLPARGGA